MGEILGHLLIIFLAFTIFWDKCVVHYIENFHGLGVTRIIVANSSRKNIS
jgi:hypothetical protein